MTLVGRDDETAILVGTLTVRSGPGRLVLVRGVPGAGKSALVEAVAGRMRSDGIDVLSVSLYPEHVALAADGVVGWIRQQIGRRPAHAAARAVNALAELHGLIGDDPARYRLALAHEFARTIALLARPGRLVILVDGAEHAPADVLSVFRPLIDQLISAGVSLVVTVRTDPLVFPHIEEAIGELVTEASAVVDLGGLDADDVGRLVAQYAGYKPDPRLVEGLMDSLGPVAGVPGAILGALAWALRSGRIVQVDGYAQLIDPDVVIQLTAGHPLLDVVPTDPALRAGIGALAALGSARPSDLSAISDRLGLADRPLRSVVSDLHRAGLLVDQDHRLRFLVPAVQATLAAEVSADTAAELHLALARRMLGERAAGRGIDGARLAEHVIGANGGVRGHDVVDVLLTESRRAQVSTPAQVAPLCIAALDLTDPASDRWPDLLRSVLPILFQHGWYADAARIAARALPTVVAANDPELIGTVQLWWVMSLAQDNRCADLVRATAVVCEVLTAAGLPAEGTRLLSAMYEEDFAKGLDMVRALREVCAVPQRQANAAAGMFWCLSVAGERAEFEDTWQRGEPGMARGPDGSPPSREDMREAASLGDVSGLREQWFGRINGRSEQGLVRRYQLVRRGFATGEWDQAMHLARHVRVRTSPDPRAFVPHLVRALAAEIQVRQGDARRAFDWLEEASEEVLYGHMVAWARCGALHMVGRDDDARRLGEHAYRRARTLGYLGGTHALLSRLVELALAVGARDEAVAWLTEAIEVDDRLGSRWSRWVSLRSRALVASDSCAAAELLTVAREMNRPYQVADAALIAGRLGVDPAVLLREAHESFRLLGADPGRTAAVIALRERGLPVPRTRLRKDTFTESELRLAALVAEGRTNRQIAAVVGVSEKTVESQLTQLFTKTGCRSRVELTVAHIQGRLGVGIPCD